MVITLIRTVVLYGVLIFAVRLMGKRQVGEMEPAEFVVPEEIVRGELLNVVITGAGNAESPGAGNVIDNRNMQSLNHILRNAVHDDDNRLFLTLGEKA